MSRVEFKYSDGGRLAAGFTKPPASGDCLTRAVTHATGRTYSDIHASLSRDVAVRGDADLGVPTNDAFQHWLAANGFEEGVEINGSIGYDDPRFRTGRYLMIIALHGMVKEGIPVGHAFAMVDGVVMDNHDYTGSSQLYVYWKLAEKTDRMAA